MSDEREGIFERPLSDEAVAALPPALIPARAPIEGLYARLEPIHPHRHAEELYAASHGVLGGDDLWRFMSYGPWPVEASFRSWLRDCAAQQDPVFFAVRESASGKAAGMASYLNIVPKNGSVEIGHIWFAPALQRTRAATEALYLMIRHAIDELGYRRVEWKCNALNEASRQAARRLGFRFEGIFYRHMIVKGRNRDTAWYSIIDSEWPAIRANMEAWLAAENFDAEGRQKRSLSAMNAKLMT